MDRKDEELKETIKLLWPIQTKKMLKLLSPPNEGQTVIFSSFNDSRYLKTEINLLFYFKTSKTLSCVA